MGTWGTGIASNDIYLDIYGDFFLQYNKGKDVKEISEYLKNVNRETIDENDSADCHNFWFALAMAQWETKALDSETLNKVKKIIETGADLKQWKELGADVTAIIKRQKALNNFLTKISVEKAKPRPRTKTKPPLFQKGDCVTFKLQNGNYGGVVILESCFDEENERSLNLGAATRINKYDRPSIEDFMNSEVLITNFQFDNDKQAIQEIDWLFQFGKTKVKAITEVTGKIDIAFNFSPEKNYGSFSRLDSWFEKVIESVLLQYQSEVVKPKYKDIKTIRELTENETWRYW